MTKKEAENEIEKILEELKEKREEIYNRYKNATKLDESSEEIIAITKKYFIEIDKIKKQIT